MFSVEELVTANRIAQAMDGVNMVDNRLQFQAFPSVQGPVEWQQSVVRADRFRYSVELRIGTFLQPVEEADTESRNAHAAVRIAPVSSCPAPPKMCN